MTETTVSRTSLTLLEQVGGGVDPLAERRFVERYGLMVRGIAKAARLGDHDVEDVVQETMIAAVQALRQQSYDRERGRFKVWLKGVLFHKIAHARRRSSRPSASAGELPGLADPAAGPEAQVEEAFEREWMKALYEEAAVLVRNEVEPQTWQAFDLVANRGWSPAEVARLLGIRRSAVDNAKSRVLQRLKDKIAAWERDEP